jgi:hypothetical protein
MSEKLKVALLSPMPLTIQMIDHNSDGSIAAVRSALLNGASAVAGFPEGITDGVDGDLYNDWIAANPDHPAVAGNLLRVVPDGEPVTEFGFEVGLARAAEDTDNVEASEEGSTITEEPPLSAEALAVPPTAAAAGIVGQVGAAPAAEEPVPAQPEAVAEKAPVAASTETPAEAETAKSEAVSEPAPAAEPAATEAKTTE